MSRVLVPTAVTPGTYGTTGYSVELDIDAYGRVTRAAVHSIPGAGAITRADLPISGNSSNPADPGVLNRGACFADGITIKVVGNGMLQVQTGYLVKSGVLSPYGVVTPDFKGQMYLTSNTAWLAMGTNNTDWMQLTFAAPSGSGGEI